MSETITFLVHGKPAPGVSNQASSDFLIHLPKSAALKQSVQVGTLRGTDADVAVTAEPGKDVVVVHIANGPSLMLHPDNARELFLAQQGTLSSTQRDGSAGTLRIPSTLGWATPAPASAQRGLFDKITIAGIDILTGVSIDQAADATTALVVKKVDGQVDPGICKLNLASLLSLKPGPVAASSNAPILMLVHGTFSSTQGTFGKLWTEHSNLVADLFESYGNRVYGFEHATLGESPIRNALLLAKGLPQGTRLHLLTHSRGGLVAEVLARACSAEAPTQDDLAMFAGPDYRADRADLAELVELVRQQAIRVERIVRVACPARGTLLASKRLDAYISVLKWALELAHIPILPSLVEFLGHVAQNKSDPDKIPGLAAQMPDSPLVKWLHSAPQPIAGELRVVAGDVQGDSVGSWIKTLLADAYYWTDNDFVVQTSSMYGGAPRAAGASFVLDRGGKVSHFSYFSNAITAGAVFDALTVNVPANFRAIGPLSAAGQDSSGSRGAPQPDPNRPAVFIIPGILGSNLAVDGERVWLGWRMLGGLDHLAYPDGAGHEIRPDGPVGLSYDKLSKFLAETHEVIEFGFDWRKPIELEAIRLGADIERALKLREASGKPVRLLAHSMGGLVARVMQLECPEVWKKMAARPGARVLMLGTPNAGSWAPMQVLSGDDSFGNKLVAFGMPFKDGAARQLMAQFPGFLQLQAGLLDPERALDRTQSWEALAEMDRQAVEKASIWHKLKLQIEAFDWGIPPQDVLDMAVKLRKRLDIQRDNGGIGAGNSLVMMVLGHAKFTPDGYTCLDQRGLMYLDAQDHGDGRVTLGSALLPGVPAWQLDAEHGDLPNVDEAFTAYLELLDAGSTTRLERFDPAAAAEGQASRGALVPNRGARRASSAPPDALGRFSADEGRAQVDDMAPPPLKVTVVNGNLKFARQPVMMGHYRSSQLTGAERDMDKLIGGSMSQSIAMGLYPERPRTHQIFLNLGENEQNPLQLPRPESVIVVGLGAEGDLKADGLSATVCAGAIAWAQRLAETHIARVDGFEIAATLMGSGGPGISAGQSARAIARGISDANRHLQGSQWPCVRHLHLTELYLDRATDAWRALTLLAESSVGNFEVDPRIAEGTGAKRRSLATGYRGAAYDMMSALTDPGSSERDAGITYILDTKRAREDVRAQKMQAPLVRMLLETASNGGPNDRELGRTLFKLLVPTEVEPFMAGSSDMQITLDKQTSAIPWEMLDTTAPDSSERDKKPWAIRVKLLRRLQTADSNIVVRDAGIGNDILVIGEPKTPSTYRRLPGAWREATAVADKLRKAGLDGNIKALISATENDVGFEAATIIKTLMANEWRIIHIAGHGAPTQAGSSGGVVLSDDTFFGQNEISNLGMMPSLVFVNCCHLAAPAPGQGFLPDPTPYERARHAASVAEALIDKGVRCVIAAGWAVDDAAAQIFATTFYEQLVAGARFIDAVAAARMSAWRLDPIGNTWAAYQCYGDPDWKLERSADSAVSAPPSLEEEFSGICSAPGLMLALESVITNARYKDEHPSDCETKVEFLDKQFGEAWGAVGVVAEAFGLAWAEARNLDNAIKWLSVAVSANDGTASIRAVEQLNNMRVLAAWEKLAATLDNKEKRPDVLQSAAIITAARLAHAEVMDALGHLRGLNQIQASLERESLCASASKRLAMIEFVTGKEDAAAAAVDRMGTHYKNAETLARGRNDSGWFYPALNGCAAQLIAGLRPGGARFAASDMEALRRCIEGRIHTDPDFQSVVGQIELSVYQALNSGTLATEVNAILKQYDDLYLRAKAPRFWNSVRDQLDFVLLFCQDALPETERAATEKLILRLQEIAPRARLSGAGGTWRKSAEPKPKRAKVRSGTPA